MLAMAVWKGDQSKGEDPPFRLFREIWAAGWTTAFGSALLNPTDVAKVRIQTEGATNTGGKLQYREFLQTARLIVVEEVRNPPLSRQTPHHLATD